MTPRHDSLDLGRRFGRRALLRGALSSMAGAAAWYALGCGSGSGDDRAAGASPSAAPSGEIRPAMLTTEFVAGQDNRFAIGVLDEENRLLRDASINARFFTVAGDGVTGTFRGEGPMSYVELNVNGAHLHDGSAQAAVMEDSVGFYLANTPFAQAGRWAVELNVTANGRQPTTVTVPFDVREDAQSPNIGDVAPRSRNDTAATNPNTVSLCSRSPACPLHDKVIADVAGAGRPLVVQFSTPAFCETRFCGPVLEVLLAQEPKYRDRVDFVHIEVWQDFQLRQRRNAIDEWNLPGEPYTFFVDGNGNVASRLEAIFTDEELSAALEALVKPA